MNGRRSDRTLEAFMERLFTIGMAALDKFHETGEARYLNRARIISKGMADVHKAETQTSRNQFGYEEHG